MSLHGICACSHKQDAPALPRPAPRASSPRACRGRQELLRTQSTQRWEFFNSNCCTRHQPLRAASVGAISPPTRGGIPPSFIPQEFLSQYRIKGSNHPCRGPRANILVNIQQADWVPARKQKLGVTFDKNRNMKKYSCNIHVISCKIHVICM